jgi:hypothetical protein
MDYNWLENVPSSLTPIPVYQPDFGFLQSMQMKANQQYEQGFKEIKTAYSSLFNKKVTGEEATKRQQDYSKQALDQMKAIAATDLSDPKNVQLADDILSPFYKDNLYLENIARTSDYQNEFGKQEAMKNSKNKEERALYNPNIDYYLSKGVEELASAPMTKDAYGKLERRKSMGIVNIADVTLQHIKDVGFIKTTDANGNVMNITTNGPKSVESYSSVYKAVASRPEYAEQNRVLSIARAEMEMDKVKKDNPNVSEQQLKDLFTEKAITGNVEYYAKSIADYRATALKYRRQNAPYAELDANGFPVDTKQNPRTAEDQAVIINNLAKAQLYEDLARKTEEEFTKGFGYIQTDANKFSTDINTYIKGIDPNSSIYQKQVNDIRTNTNDYIQNLYLSHDADAFAKSLANLSSVETKVNPVQQEVNKQAAEAFKEQLALFKAVTGVEQKQEEIDLKELQIKIKAGTATQEDYDKAYGAGFTMKRIGTDGTNKSGIDIASGDIDMPGTNVKQVATNDTYNTAKVKLAIDINRDSFGPDGMLNMITEDIVPNGLTGPEKLDLSNAYMECLETGKYSVKSLAVREKAAKLVNDLAKSKDKVYTADTGPNTIREGLGVIATTDAADPLFLTQNPLKQDVVMKMAMKNQLIQKNSAELLNLTSAYQKGLKEFLDNDKSGKYKVLINSKTNDFYTSKDAQEVFELPTLVINSVSGKETKTIKGEELANLWNSKNFRINTGRGSVNINNKEYTISNINGFDYSNNKPFFPDNLPETNRTPYHATLDLEDVLHGRQPSKYSGQNGEVLPYPNQVQPKLNNGVSFYNIFGEPGQYKEKLSDVGKNVVAKMPQFATGESSPELTYDMTGTGKEIDPVQKATGTKLIKEALLPINHKNMYTVDRANKMVGQGLDEDMKKAIIDGRFKDFIYDIAGAITIVPIGPNSVPAVRINTQPGKGEKDNETIGNVSIRKIKDLGVIYMDIATDAKGDLINQIPQVEKFQRYQKLLTDKEAELVQDDFEAKNGFVYVIKADAHSKDQKGLFTKVHVFTSQWQVDKKTGAYIIDPKTGKPAPTPLTEVVFDVGTGGYSIDHIAETMKNNWILNEMQKRRMLLENSKNQPSAAGTMSFGDIMKQFGYK